MVNKITTPPTQNEVIDKINELVDDKQDVITSSNKLPASLVSGLATVATSGSYTDLNNKPTIPTVNNATLTIQKNGSNVATFTANASSNVTANISVPTTTSSVTSGSTAALTSGGAYTNLVRRKSTSSSTGSTSQGVYVDANGQVQTCNAVTSTYTATGTAPLNGVAVSNAIATKQDNLVSGTNIKTINGNSLLGSGNITIETSSTPNVDGETISYNASDALQTIAVKNVRDDSTLPIWHGTEYQWNHGDPTTWYYWQTSVTALWTSGGSLPSSAKWSSVTYGNSKFVAVASGSDKAAYSTDGINWTASTFPSSAGWRSVTYGDGKFVAVANSSNESAYSTDGVNWTESTLPSSTNWTSVTYGDGKFVAVAYGSDASAIFSVTYDKCYTDTANPTTTSVVYSAPETISSYTISRVTSGAITLSNNNTYYYNQSGNAYTYQSMGVAHPEYLCFIDGVGVKMGNTFIATNNSNS